MNITQTLILAGGWLIALVTLPFILLSEKRPAGMLAWMWAVLLFPYIGAFAYLLFGSERIYRRHLKRRRKWSHRRGSVEPLPLEGHDPRNRELASLLSSINVHSSSRYDEVEVFLHAQEFYPALAAEIKEAKSSILIEFFIWRNDEYGKNLRDVLTEAAGRGVAVRVIIDEMGCFGLPRGYFSGLIEAGGKFSWFNALHVMRNRWNFSLRNHRKLQIIDGKIAFVGGMNIGREYMGDKSESGGWKDAQIRLSGAVVRALCQTFWEDWYFATDEDMSGEKNLPSPIHGGRGLAQVVEDGPDSQQYPIMLSTVALLNAARRRVWFAAGYFFPTEPFLSALKLCVARGVEVRILIPAKSDHPYLVKGARAYYEELLTYGVRLYEYTCGTHHAKVIIMDDEWASVGSANLDVRSMRLNFELNVILHSTDVVTKIEKELTKDYISSHEVTLDEVRSRSMWTRLIENICRLLGPIL
ncbi:MAG: cardiolipin synthase [Verrucomicrobiota bacterium]|nr:cardiolipin synthase [Verrucomicrobiota bacterium]